MLKIEVNDAGRVVVEVSGTPLRIMAEFGAAAHDIMESMANEGVPVEATAYAMAQSISKAINLALGGKGGAMVHVVRPGDGQPDIAELVNRIKEGGHA